MERRLKLHDKLVELLGSENVYFQPPSSIKLSYPCIIYSLSAGDTQFADNIPYIYSERYQIMIITRNPDDDIRMKVKDLPQCIFDRRYVLNNLYHDVFNVYI